MAVADLSRDLDLPNSSGRISERLNRGLVGPTRVWGMLLLRPFLAIALQAIFAVGLALSGRSGAWQESADIWLVTFALAEFLNLWALGRAAEAEGLRLRDIYNPGGRATRKGDLKWFLVAFLIAGPVAFLPNLLIGGWLWGSAEVGSELLFHPVPVVLAWVTVLVFPLIHGATELPTYFGYVMPRLQAMWASRWRGLLVAASVLSIQHVFLPLLFDWRYLIWRTTMFLGLAVWLGWVVDRRPTALPYLAAGHALLDLSLPLLVLAASMG